MKIKRDLINFNDGLALESGAKLDSFELMVETGSIEALSSLATASCKITQGEFQQMQISNKPETSIEKYFE